MAGYDLDNHNAWFGLQIFPSSRLEIFANTLYNRGNGAITDFGYDAGALTSTLVGLDYALQSQSFSGFSDLDMNRFDQVFGFNYRLTNELMLTAFGDYANYDDNEPWLYDATGKFFNFYAGVNWIF